MNQPVESPSPRRLDLRGLDPPEPMQHALEAVEALDGGEVVHIITDREPLLLYRELDRRGHSYFSESDPEGFRIAIRHGGKKGVQ